MRADERRERVERQKAKEEKEEKDKNKEDDFLNLVRSERRRRGIPILTTTPKTTWPNAYTSRYSGDGSSL